MRYTIFYWVYVALMGLQGFTCACARLTFNKWEFWVLLIVPLAAYLCGHFAA